MISHKEQPAVDTSAERLLALAAEAKKMASAIYIAVEKEVADDISTRLRRFADAFTALAAHPAEPEGMELETTAEERAEWSEYAIHPTGFVARLLRDFDRMRARAEKAEAESAGLRADLARVTAANDLRVDALVQATLATYQQPVGDEEVEALARRLDQSIDEADAPFMEDVEQAAKFLRRLYRRIESFEADSDAYKARLATIRRHEDLIRDLTAERDALSTQLRDAQARGKGMEEALIDARERGLIYWEPNTQRGHETKDAMLVRIDAALSRPEGSAP